MLYNLKKKCKNNHQNKRSLNKQVSYERNFLLFRQMQSMRSTNSRRTCSFLGLHVGQKIDHSVGIPELIVIPRHQLDESRRQLNSSLRVENRRSFVADEVSGDYHFVSVAEETLHGPRLTGLLQLSADLLIAGLLLEPHGKVDDGHVRCRHPEGHAGEFSVKVGDDLTDSFGRAGGGGDNVLGGSTPATPILLAGAVHGLLGGRGGVHGGHQTLENAEVVVDDHCERSQTVGGAGGVGDNLHVVGVRALIDAHHEHGGVGGGRGDDHFLGAPREVGGGFLRGGEHACGLHHVLGSYRSPGDGGGVALVEDGDGVSVDHELAVLHLHVALVLPMGGVVLEHVDHVVEGDEGVVDSHNGHSLLEGCSQDEAADTAKSVNSDRLRHGDNR